MPTLQKLTYRFTLDAFKNGIQRILQGWVTGENLSRKLEISLVSGHDTYELPLEGLTASMYVTTPTTHTLSINACEIDYENNKIIYDVLDSDISEAGLVNLQLKVFDNEKILISPSFQLEVWESTISDSQAVQSPTYTALTAALAQAEAYAEKAISQVYVDEDYTFVIEFADGTEYTSSALKDCFEDCEAERLKAEGWAVGKQDGEDVTSGSPYYQNNAKYYSGQANGYKSMAENAKNYAYGYANDALGYKNDASGYATTAGAKATLAESYAVGGTGTRTGEDDDNAKHYKEVCEQIAASLEGGFLPMGTIAFESLPTENVEYGWMYNISNDFVTDSRFKDGSGKAYPAGTNVYFTGDNMWDCLSAPYQTAENTSYDNTESGLVSDDVQGALDEVAEEIHEGTQTLAGNPISFTTDSEEVADATIVTYSPTQSGSGDPSPSNERPFVGQDSLQIRSSDLNLVLYKLESVSIGNSSQHGAIVSNESNNVYVVKVTEGEKYTIVNGDSSNIVAYYYDEPRLGSYSYNEDRSSGESVLTAPITGYLAVRLGKSNDATQFGVIAGEETQTVTNLADINIALDSTIYGGTWDVEKGLLTVTHARVDMGSLTWSYTNSPTYGKYFSVSIPEKKKGVSNVQSEIYKNTTESVENMPDLSMRGANGNTNVFIVNLAYTNASDFTSAVTGHYIVYELETPIVLHLTPHVVELLNGENIVTSNGTSIALTYRKGDIAKLSDLVELADGINELAELSDGHKGLLTALFTAIAPTEETDTATIAHSTTSNKYFFNKDHEFCKATASISVGATLTKNTNYSVTSIGAELLSLS